MPARPHARLGPRPRGPRGGGEGARAARAVREFFPPPLPVPHHRPVPAPHTTLTKESVMGIIAWIVLGLAAGLLANMLIPGKRSQGLVITCLIGIAGALGGGWAATQLFHMHTLHGFFNLSTWLTAIAGSAILLVAYRVIDRRTGP